jgi:hypothetical protein
MINIEDLATGIIQAVIVGILTFSVGILFADPIKNKINEWRRVIMVRTRKKTPVRVFFILCPLCSDDTGTSYCVKTDYKLCLN